MTKVWGFFKTNVSFQKSLFRICNQQSQIPSLKKIFFFRIVILFCYRFLENKYGDAVTKAQRVSFISY